MDNWCFESFFKVLGGGFMMSFNATVFWTENQSRSNCNVDFFENKREK